MLAERRARKATARDRVGVGRAPLWPPTMVGHTQFMHTGAHTTLGGSSSGVAHAGSVGSGLAACARARSCTAASAAAASTSCCIFLRDLAARASRWRCFLRSVASAFCSGVCAGRPRPRLLGGVASAAVASAASSSAASQRRIAMRSFDVVRDDFRRVRVLMPSADRVQHAWLAPTRALCWRERGGIKGPALSAGWWCGRLLGSVTRRHQPTPGHHGHRRTQSTRSALTRAGRWRPRGRARARSPSPPRGAAPPRASAP